MEDIDGPLVAESLYKELFKGQLNEFDPSEVPYALDEAVQRLRHIHREPSRWALYIHMGM
jgi:hypothetical protein